MPMDRGRLPAMSRYAIIYQYPDISIDENTIMPIRKEASKTVATGRSRPARGRSGTRNADETVRKMLAAKPDSCACVLVVGERAGREQERVGQSATFAVRSGGTAGGGGGGPANAPAIRPGSRSEPAAHWRRGGSMVRARLLAKMLEGPCTYRSLASTTKLGAGPLYHHIQQLRLAGLILPKQRDLYELTRAGRNLILTMSLLGPMLSDTRRRPPGGA